MDSVLCSLISVASIYVSAGSARSSSCVLEYDSKQALFLGCFDSPEWPSHCEVGIKAVWIGRPRPSRLPFRHPPGDHQDVPGLAPFRFTFCVLEKSFISHDTGDLEIFA